MPIHISDAFKTSDFAARQTGLLFNLPVPGPEVVQPPAGVSLCMIVKNEERFLEACLESVKEYVDEINIVDTGSTDRTLEIARRYTDRIVQREWKNDFAWARNEAISMATKRWTFVLDADEELTADSGPTLVALRDTPADITPVYLKILNTVDDQSGVGMMTHLLPRIFPSTPRIRYHGVIHENIGLTDSTDELGGVLSPIKVIHKGYTEAIIEGRQKSARNLPLLEKAVEDNGDNSFSWFNYGMSAIGAEDAQRGIEAFEKMFALDSQTGVVRSYHALAYIALAAGYAYKSNDVEKALATIDACLALDAYKDYTNAHFTRGDILTYAQRFEEARESFVRAIESRSHAGTQFMVDDEIFLWKAQYNIAVSYLRQNQPDKAAEWFANALVNKPDSILIRRQHARALERAGKFFDAELAFRELFDARPDDIVVVDYVDFLIRRGRNTRALEVIEDALETTRPEYAVTLQIGAAVIADAIGSGDAVRYLKAALATAPANASALQLLEKAYRESGDTEALTELLRAELESTPQSVADFARRSHRYLEERSYEEALEAARRGLLLSPDDGVLLYNAAAAELQLGNRTAAIAKLERVNAETMDVYPTALFLRAELLEDQPERALAALAELEAVQPGHVDGVLLHFAILEKMGRFGEAESLLRSSMHRGAQRIGVALAGLLMRAGRMDEAGKIAELALAEA